MRLELKFQIATLVAFFGMACAAHAENYLMRHADVHGDTIVFTYEGDLWLVSTAGGDARRITRDPGEELYAKFSPDGRQLAFTGEYDGGVDVYVMDSGGGVPKRLTFHPSADRVLDWHPDGQHILFRSNRQYPHRGEEIYLVSIAGGMPEKLPVDRAGLSSLSPDGKSIAYNRQSRESRTWKRHKGGTAQDIWMGNLSRQDYRRITEWEGSDNYPMWHGDSIYFNSDRNEGTLNLHRYDIHTQKVSALTDYDDYDVKYPSIGDKAIVFQYGEMLYLLDLATGAITRVDVRIASDRVRMRAELMEVSPTTGSFALSPTGKRALLEARGEIINFPVEDGEPINLTRTTESREKNAAWSPNGKWVAFISDRTGEEEVYLVGQDGKEKARQLTSGGFGFRMPLKWSPDSNHIIFSDKFMRLNLVDVDTGTLRVVDAADYDDAWERWGIQDYSWSPDSKWIAYTKMEQSMNEAIFLYSIDRREAFRVTDEMYEDFSPSFDPQGKYLYFLSNRSFSPVMGFVDQNHVFLDMCRPYVLILDGDAVSPFAPKDSREENVSDADDQETTGDEDPEPDFGEIVVQVEGIASRIVPADGVPSGNYFRLEAVEDGFCYLKKERNEFTKYQSVTDQTGGKLDLYTYSIKDAETKRIISGIANYHLSGDGKKLIYRSGSTYGVVDTGKDASVGDGKIALDTIKILVDRQQEYAQIFDEAWRVQRDWFYDEQMHGLDWEATLAKYKRFVPFCGNRGDLNYLIGEMIGELNIGHTYVWGGDVETDSRVVSTGVLGCTFKADPGSSFYTIDHIIPGTPGNPSERSPLTEPGCPITEGHYLIAIDETPVTTAGNVYAFLQGKSDCVVTLTYNDKPAVEDAKSWRVRTLASERAIQYREWVNNNRSLVEQMSGGRLGYLHIPDMGRDGLIEFAKVFYSQYYKDGFVIDERYNGGGFTADMIIDRLERKIWGMTQPREGKVLRDPERIFCGPMVVLINEDTGSCGEMFAEAIKIKKLAPVIGKRTWGGAIGIEPHQDLTDGGTTTPPQFGLYGLDRKWLIEGRGVEPDIEVENMPGDVVRGKDSQLEAGIDHLLHQLEKNPIMLPQAPEYPDKSRKAD